MGSSLRFLFSRVVNIVLLFINIIGTNRWYYLKNAVQADRGTVEPPPPSGAWSSYHCQAVCYSTTTIIILHRVLLFLLYRELPNCGLDMIMVKVKSQLSMQRALYRRGDSASALGYTFMWHFVTGTQC